VTNAEAQRRERSIDQAVAAGDIRRAADEAEDYCDVSEGHAEGDALSPRFRACYLAAQVALAGGRLGLALCRLETLLPACDRLTPELAARLRLFAAEALARLRRGDEARAQLARAPAAPLAKGPLLRLRALRVRLWLGDLADLGADLAACARDLEASGDAANHALLLCEEGRARDRAGDLPGALSCWQRAERLADPGDAPLIRADVLVQLGRLDHLRGHLGAALDRFDAACRCAPDGPHAQEAALRRLLVLLDLGRREQARAEAACWLDGGPDGLPEELRPLAEMVRGLLDGTAMPGASDEVAAYLAALRGDVAAARSLYAAALAAEPSPERRARLALALGLLAANHGSAEEAQSWLGEAEALARDRDLPEVLARALQVCGQLAAERDGDDDLARRLFGEAVRLFEAQAALIADPIARAAYRGQRGSVLGYLLRSACRRGDAAAAFRYQERERGMLLLDLLRSTAAGRARPRLFDRPDVADLQGRLDALDKGLEGAASGEERRELSRRREELLQERDRLFEDHLGDRGRSGDGVLPPLPELADLSRALPRQAVYLAPVLAGDELFLLAATRAGPARVVRASLPATALRSQIDGLRHCLAAQMARYQAGRLGPGDRAELDGLLDEIGAGPLGAAAAEALAETAARRVIWAPDGPLHGLPVHALRRGGRYLVETHDFVWATGGAALVHQARGRRRWAPWRPAVVVAESPAVLPAARREGEGVAAAFLRGRLLPEATGRAALRRWLARARVAHFACHADFDGRRPLAACVRLPSGEAVHALEWLDEPVAGLPLVTLSACRSAEVGPLIGREVFGLVTGLLGGGVRAVLAGLWPVADAEAGPLMWRFYRQRLTHDLAAALALAQREALAEAGGSPLFWAAFALHGDADALPPAGPFGRWLARRRQRRHARTFPVA
jgi:CHAT domain-containing protein